MRRFVEGIDRGQATLFPEHLEDWIDADNPVRVIDAFVEELDLSGLGFEGVASEATGRPSYHPAVLLKLYIYGYLNRVQSSRRADVRSLKLDLPRPTSVSPATVSRALRLTPPLTGCPR